MNHPRAAALATACAAIGLSLGLLLFLDPWSRLASHSGRMWLAGFAVMAVGIRAAMGEFSRWIPWFRGVLVVACTAGWFNYYGRSPASFAGIDDLSDITFYYLNSKYLDELGHYGLYPAMMLADLETNDRHTSHIEQYRDLRDDQLRPVVLALEHGAKLKEQFSPERWQQFCHDDDWLLGHQSLAEIRYIYVDHGYNPPPTWSIVGGTLSGWVPVELLKALAFLDVGLVAGSFLAVGLTFGVEPCLWAMLFFLTTFSGRWPMLGQALLRFDWLCALIGAMCALRRDRYGLAGALLGFSAASRVFPVIFLGAWLWEALADSWRARSVPPRHLRFAGAATGVIAFLSAAALVRYGPSICGESVENLALHARSFSSHRVGAGVVATWRGELTREDLHLVGGMVHREQVVQGLLPALQAIAALLVGVTALASWRTRRPAWETLAWLILPLFFATNPQVNYWNLRIIPVIWHAAWLVGPRPAAPVDRWFHGTGLLVLFATELAAHWMFLANHERHAVNAIASWGIAVWSAGLLAWLGLLVVRGPLRLKDPGAKVKN